jgi:hypothetical protein
MARREGTEKQLVQFLWSLARTAMPSSRQACGKEEPEGDIERDGKLDSEAIGRNDSCCWSGVLSGETQ